MSDATLFSRPYGDLLVDPSVPCVISQWHGFANAAEFIELMQVGLDYLQAHATPGKPWGWVGDVRHMGAIPAKAQAWLISEFNPQATAAGLREVSVVVAENIFGQLSSQRYAQETSQARDRYELRTVFYDSLEAAKTGAKLAIAEAAN